MLRVFALVSLFALSWTHPQCLDFQPPFSPDEELKICKLYDKFGCCATDHSILQRYNEIVNSLTIDKIKQCSGYIRDILCQTCSPFAAHLYFAESSPNRTYFPSLCSPYMRQILQNCSEILPLLNTSFPIPSPDPFYCYPDVAHPNQTTNLGVIGRKNNCLQLCVKEVARNIYTATSGKPANDGTNRMFVTEQRGLVWIFLSNFTKLSPAFIDINDDVYSSGRPFDERGLLDITFHPDYKINGRFYLYYTHLRARTHIIRISEFKVSDGDMNRGNRSSERVIIEIEQPAANHNGGPLLFRDGFLYIFTGDGGRAGDPYGHGQNLQSLLGKVLRVDVDHLSGNESYSVPPSNPFVNRTDAKPEIYAYGLRNPWKCTMDRGNHNGRGSGRIFCADVGQNRFEEVDIITPGANYGWNGFEGNSCYSQSCQRILRHTRPIHAYSHSVGKSITGGYVYRGCQSPNLRGKYIFGDWSNGKLFLLQRRNGRWERRNICMGGEGICVNDDLRSLYARSITSFAEDEFGEVYIISTTYSQASNYGGRIYQLVDPSRRGNPEQCQREEQEVTFHPDTTLYPYKAMTANSLEIRLVHPLNNPKAGRVEIRRPGGSWGTICDDRWRQSAANVVCRMLGYRLALTSLYKFQNRAGTGRIWLDDVRCRGNEMSLLECSNNGWGVNDCSHLEDVAVRCL